MKNGQYKKVPCIQNEKGKADVPEGYGCGIRHVQSFLLFMSLALGYISRGHLGVTIVAMTDIPIKETSRNLHNDTILFNANNSVEAIINDTGHDENLQDLPIQFGHDNIISLQEHEKDGVVDIFTTGNETNITSIWNIKRTYDWSKSTQEMVQGAFFMGYFVTMFPMGLVVQRWGGKFPLQLSLFINGVIPMFIPWLTPWGGWKVLCACRFVQGVSQAGLYPAVHTLLASWVPVGERARLSTCVYTGSGFGTIVAFQLGGVLAESAWGWPSSFWITGLMCLVGLALVTIFGANRPSEHKSVSEREKNYIHGSLGNNGKKIAKTPWKQLLTSKCAWACFSGHVGSGVTFVFFLTQFPTYMHAILHFNIKSSGLLSSLPYMFALVTTPAFGYLSDFCTNRKILSIRNARIMSNVIGGVGTATCLVAVTVTRQPTLAVIIFTAMLSLHGAGHTGWMVNYMDLAPNYSGALMAFGNTLCNSLIVSLPVVVSSVVTDVKNPYQWRIVFLLMAGVAFMANAFFVLFMSADIQSWNNIEENNESEELKLKECPEEKNEL